ncbi:NAD-dependent epimerase/dehydratase [Dendrothele bispora CBS 962.96]|uniref:NAD-dependent epimerase/dehydratase n=1 Tax=Dendrothele bispora (strain CBS 962.96) TaxID=1314807 RepID=A0A4S8MJN5_DENBC|nr:NAD-dependent epimerase/dehydratase [Dendrothele bispora CBS 962.96]
MQSNPEKRILVTGGHGFIGSHVAARLVEMKFGHIRIADLSSGTPTESFYEFVQGNLCDEAFCKKVVHGMDIVLHFAANMGGMGTIHSTNGFIIYQENHLMTTNLLKACVAAGVKTFFFASSACVYSEGLQSDPDSDVSLREQQVADFFPPRPQGLYGLEKLVSEFVLQNTSSSLNIRIARFHNVYGPGGTWSGGREKAPAALLRKAFAKKLLEDTSSPFEIWGNGDQRRSFLWIGDAVDGVVKMLQSDKTGPFNIGSEESVSIKQLARFSLRHAGLDPDAVGFEFDTSKPVGVASRNSNNDLVSLELGWKPTTPLEEGLKLTGRWIEGEMQRVLEGCRDNEQRISILRQWTESDLVNLSTDQCIVFAVLLPVTSRGGVEKCLANLRRFAHSLFETTWRDTNTLGGTRFRVKVYLALDRDDTELQVEGRYNKAHEVFFDENVLDITTLVREHPKGHVCWLWRDCAKQAWEDGCHYMVLLGDDVELKDEGWMRKAHCEFGQLAEKQNVPLGFGCVAFTDISFPGMPTFPIIHRTHLDIFDGEVVPATFINQDGDPYLFQLYRRWGCSVMFTSRVTNGIGGESEARYEKVHAVGWTFDPLEDGVRTVEKWLHQSYPNTHRKVTLDVVIPCYRVLVDILDKILNLQTSETCTTMFIVIIDNPNSPFIHDLKAKYGARPDVRIRVNKSNLGASESRNRGMKESSADWIHFLDDDIVPSPDLLFKVEEAIRAHPNAAGFVGNALFPCASTIFTTAVHLAGVTYFWDIASKIPDDLPWGVTANLVARRHKDNVYFDPSFPKTGGGEDIDFCRKKREYSLSLGGNNEGFRAAPEVVVTHPWWNEGKRSYWRFHMWSVGDGALVKLYPEHCYRTRIPNSAEMILLCVLMTLGALHVQFSVVWWLFVLRLASRTITAIVLANVLHDCYCIIWRNAERYTGLNTSIGRMRYFLAVVESTFIRMFSEMGRLRGILARKEFSCIGKRFDWFTGRWGDGPRNEELVNSGQRAVFVVLLFCAMYFF